MSPETCRKVATSRLRLRYRILGCFSFWLSACAVEESYDVNVGDGAPRAELDAAMTGGGAGAPMATGGLPMLGTGGVTATGGATMVPDSGVGHSGGGGTDCPAMQKRCGGICVDMGPGFGCGPTGCDGCEAPPMNAASICVGELCSFECDEGFTVTEDQSGCTDSVGGGGAANTGGVAGGGTMNSGGAPPATGGAPPATGGGGGATACNPDACPSCLISGILGQPCCKSDATCGCEAIFGILPCE